MKYNRKHILSNWNIFQRNSREATVLGRVIVGVLLLAWGLGLANKAILPALVLFSIFDLAHYVGASVSYQLLARLQELNILSCVRPTWVNYAGCVFWGGKFVVLFVLLHKILISL